MGPRGVKSRPQTGRWKKLDEGEERKSIRKRRRSRRCWREELVDRWTGDNALWHVARSGAGCPNQHRELSAILFWPLTFLSSGYDGGCCRPLLVMLVANGIYFPFFFLFFLFVERRKRENKRWWAKLFSFQLLFFLFVLYFRFQCQGPNWTVRAVNLYERSWDDLAAGVPVI